MTPLYTKGQQVQTTRGIGRITHIRAAAGGLWPTTYTVAIPGKTPDMLYHETELAPVKGVSNVTDTRSLPAGRVIDLHRNRRRRLLSHHVPPDAPEAA